MIIVVMGEVVGRVSSQIGARATPTIISVDRHKKRKMVAVKTGSKKYCFLNDVARHKQKTSDVRAVWRRSCKLQNLLCTVVLTDLCFRRCPLNRLHYSLWVTRLWLGISSVANDSKPKYQHSIYWRQSSIPSFQIFASPHEHCWWAYSYVLRINSLQWT